MLVGLDDWSARVAVAEDLRAAASACRWIQTGLARDEAQVFVYGAGAESPCPCCRPGTRSRPPSRAWPGRGTASSSGETSGAKAQAAGRFAARVLGDLAGFDGAGGRRWMDTKTNLSAKGAGGEFERFTRKCRARPGCLGPHGGAGPIRWDRELGPVLEEVG